MGHKGFALPKAAAGSCRSLPRLPQFQNYFDGLLPFLFARAVTDVSDVPVVAVVWAMWWRGLGKDAGNGP